MKVDYKIYSYIFSRAFELELDSHREQNRLIREYCSRHNLEFPLANTEFVTEDSFFVLNSLLDEIKNASKILISAKTLFEKNAEMILPLLKENLNKDIQFTFCREDCSLTIKELIEDLEFPKEKILSLFKDNHTSTKRDYFQRMNAEKFEKMIVSKKFSYDYWDGDRSFGYGGYEYDGRWKSVAKKLIAHYNLSNESKILDIGCGKGYLLYEIKELLPGATIAGVDISKYAVDNSKEEVRSYLSVHDIREELPYSDKSFDLTLSLMTLHNLELPELELALAEISRVSKNSYISVESYRNERELTNLQCWALSCEAFFSPRSWEHIFKQSGYIGDFEFLFFE